MREITITERSGQNLTDYQVMIILNDTNFDFTHTQTNGADIRFTDANGNLLDYWIEEWSADTKQAKVWVKVPNIPANGTTKIYMYYGNPKAESKADGSAVAFRGCFYDFKSYVTLQSLKPASADSGYGYFYISIGFDTLLTHPEIVYVPSINKTFIAYMGGTVDSHDIRVLVLPDNKEVSLGSPIDEHGAPGILVRESDGKIVVIWSGHSSTTSAKISVADNFDINNFTTSNFELGTYWSGLVYNDKFIVFYRGETGYWRKAESTDGSTWTHTDCFKAPHGTLGLGYFFWRKFGDRLYFAGVEGHGIDTVNVYAFYYDLTIDRFYDLAGNELTTPFDQSSMTLIYNSAGNQTKVCDVFYRDDKLYIAFKEGDYDKTIGDFTLKLAIYNFSTHSVEIADLDYHRHYIEGGLFIEENGKLYFLCPKHTDERGGDLYKYDLAGNKVLEAVGIYEAGQYCVSSENYEHMSGRITYGFCKGKSNSASIAVYGDDYPKVTELVLPGSWSLKNADYGDVDIEKDWLVLKANGGAGGAIVYDYFLGDFTNAALRCKCKSSSPQDSINLIFSEGSYGAHADPRPGYRIIWYGWGNTQTHLRKEAEDGSTLIEDYISDSAEADKIYVLELAWSNGTIKALRDGATILEISDDSPFSNLKYIALACHSNSVDNIWKVDFMFLRKYVEPELSVSLGGEITKGVSITDIRLHRNSIGSNTLEIEWFSTQYNLSDLTFYIDLNNDGVWDKVLVGCNITNITFDRPDTYKITIKAECPNGSYTYEKTIQIVSYHPLLNCTNIVNKSGIVTYADKAGVLTHVAITPVNISKEDFIVVVSYENTNASETGDILLNMTVVGLKGGDEIIVEELAPNARNVDIYHNGQFYKTVPVEDGKVKVKLTTFSEYVFVVNNTILAPPKEEKEKIEDILIFVGIVIGLIAVIVGVIYLARRTKAKTLARMERQFKFFRRLK